MSSFTARVGVLGSQLFRAEGNTETGFSDIVSIAYITAWQSFIKEGAYQGQWGPVHISVAVQVLIWTVPALFGVLAEDVLVETFAG